MHPALQHSLRERLAKQRSQHRWRQVKRLESSQGVEVASGSQRLINFSSNDYLSLASHPSLMTAMSNTVHSTGVGSGASHLISGHHLSHHRLEQTIADWTGREAVALFSSGYQANLAMVLTFVDKHHLLLHDKLNHASLIDAARRSPGKQKRFLHANPESLRRQYEPNFDLQWVLTDGVFSMDGDIAPLPQYLADAPDNMLLMVDDAHGLGVLGDTGAGTLEHFNLSSDQVPLLMGTLGKAVGTSGAFIAGDKEVIECVTQFAREYIYTTAMPPCIAEVSRQAIDMIRQQPTLREELIDKIQQFKSLCAQAGLPMVESHTAIQLMLLDNEATCMRVAASLMKQGFWVGAIRPPTVPAGTARLRITINREHTTEMIEGLVAAIKHALADENDLSLPSTRHSLVES